MSQGMAVQIDTYPYYESQPDQEGAGAVLTFTFIKKMDLIWILARGADARAAFGTTETDPTASAGVPCLADTPMPMNIHTDTVRVYADSGDVSVWGFGYSGSNG